MPAYHLIFVLQQFCPGLFYPQTILLQQLSKDSSHTAPKTPFPAERCASHERCTIIPTRKMCISTQFWVVLEFRAITQLCSVQGTKQTLNMDHVQFYLAWYLVLDLNLVNPTLAFRFLSLHLPASISPCVLTTLPQLLH